MEEEHSNETLSAEKDTDHFENKIPAQYKALQDAAQTGLQYVDEIAEEPVR